MDGARKYIRCEPRLVRDSFPQIYAQRAILQTMSLGR